MEPLSAVFWVFGLIALAMSWILLLIESFKHDYTWGLTTILLPPLAYFYALFRWNRSREIILIAITGWVCIFLAWS